MKDRLQCPEGEIATISADVEQVHENGSTTRAFGNIEEDCRNGPNTAVVTVAVFQCGVPCFFDVGPAHAVWTIATFSALDTDEKDILIQAR